MSLTVLVSLLEIMALAALGLAAWLSQGAATVIEVENLSLSGRPKRPATGRARKTVRRQRHCAPRGCFKKRLRQKLDILPQDFTAEIDEATGCVEFRMDGVRVSRKVYLRELQRQFIRKGLDPARIVLPRP